MYQPSTILYVFLQPGCRTLLKPAEQFEWLNLPVSFESVYAWRCSTKERKTGNVKYNFPFGRWFQLFNQCHWTCRYLTRVKCMGFFPCLRGCTKTISCLWGEGGDDRQWLQNKSQQNCMGMLTKKFMEQKLFKSVFKQSCLSYIMCMADIFLFNLAYKINIPWIK